MKELKQILEPEDLKDKTIRHCEVQEQQITISFKDDTYVLFHNDGYDETDLCIDDREGMFEIRNRFMTIHKADRALAHGVINKEEHSDIVREVVDRDFKEKKARVRSDKVDELAELRRLAKKHPNALKELL